MRNRESAKVIKMVSVLGHQEGIEMKKVIKFIIYSKQIAMLDKFQRSSGKKY